MENKSIQNEIWLLVIGVDFKELIYKSEVLEKGA